MRHVGAHMSPRVYTLANHFSEPCWPDLAGAIKPTARRRDLIVKEVVTASPDTVLLRLCLDDSAAADTDDVTGLLTPSCWVYSFHIVDASGNEVARPYTPIASTTKSALFLIKRYESGKATPYLHRLRPGDPLTTVGPLEPEHGAAMHSALYARGDRGVAVLAAGTGITPFFALLYRALLVNYKTTASVQLVTFNTRNSDILLRSELRALQLAAGRERLVIEHVLSSPSFDWTGGRGRVSRELIGMLGPRVQAVLISGPSKFVDASLFLARERRFEAVVGASNVFACPTLTPSSKARRPAASGRERTREETDVLHSLSEVQAHEHWMVINGNVYDVASFVAIHPGGSAILQGCSRDATSLFEASYHGDRARALLRTLKIGRLGERPAGQEAQAAAPADPAPTAPALQRPIAMKTEPVYVIPMRDMYAVLGEHTIKNIAKSFYARVWADEHELADMFRQASVLDHATHMLTLFLIQSLGGPDMYGGFEMPASAIRTFHRNLRVTLEYRDRWLHHMRDTLNDPAVGVLGHPRASDVVASLMAWFQEFATEMVNC